MKRSNFFHSPGFVWLLARSGGGADLGPGTAGAGTSAPAREEAGRAGMGSGAVAGTGGVAFGSGVVACSVGREICRARVAIAPTTGWICSAGAFCCWSCVSTATRADSAGGGALDEDCSEGRLEEGVGSDARLLSAVRGLQIDLPGTGGDMGTGAAAVSAGSGLDARLGGGCSKGAGIGRGSVLP